MFIEDSQEGQSECAHLLHKGQQLCWQQHQNRQLEREYLPYMFMYVSTNSCVDRLNTEGSRDSASWMTQTADKRRKHTMPAETDEQK